MTRTAGLAALLVALGAHGAAAQTYPDRDIRVVVGFSAGGTTDLLGRLFADYLGQKSGRTVIVENMPGAGGNIATGAVVNAEPDGYTLLSASTGNIVINQFLYETMTFDPLTALVPVAHLAEAPAYIAVRDGFPAQGLEEFFEEVRSRPGEVTFASSGAGSTTHLGPLAIARAQELDMVHVPYGGAGPAAVDLGSGRVDMMNIGVNVLQNDVEAGNIRLLAVASEERVAAFPDVPTTIEQGFDYVDKNWFAIFAPAGTPDEIVDYLHGVAEEMLADPAILARLEGLYQTARPMSRQEFSAYLQAEAGRWQELIEAEGVTLD